MKTNTRTGIDFPIFGDIEEFYNVTDKKCNIHRIAINFLAKLQSMFKYQNLPNSLTSFDIEKQLMLYGHTLFFKSTQEKYFCLYGGFGGDPNAYYTPTKYIITNPYIPTSDNKTYTIGDNCVLIKNDTFFQPITNIVFKYATMLAEIELTFIRTIQRLRSPVAIVTNTDNEEDAANKFFQKLEKGEQGVLASTAFLDGMRGITLNPTDSLVSQIETFNFIRATFFQEIGLNSQNNFKRESLNSPETELNKDIIVPYVQDMLNCRQSAIKQINDMFGLNISVNFASVWSDDSVMEEDEKTEEGEHNET